MFWFYIQFDTAHHCVSVFRIGNPYLLLTIFFFFPGPQILPVFELKSLLPGQIFLPLLYFRFSGTLLLLCSKLGIPIFMDKFEQFVWFQCIPRYICMQFTSSLLKIGNPYFYWKFIGMFDYKKFLCHYNLLHFFYIYIAKMKGQTQLKTLSKDCTANAHHFWNLQKKQAGQK